jgi:hypothetical protein
VRSPVIRLCVAHDADTRIDEVVCLSAASPADEAWRLDQHEGTGHTDPKGAASRTEAIASREGLPWR